MSARSTMPSNNGEQVEQALENFLEGRYSLSQVQELLKDYLVIDFDSAPGRRVVENTVDDEFIKIVVNERHVRQMLQRYILGELGEIELSNWAAFVFMLPMFVPEGGTEEERWESGKGPVWDILQKLVTPDLFDGLTPEVARHYLDRLV